MVSHTIYADAALFDMDGTLTDSIAAVEAAWDKVARDIGQDPQYVIAATHGKRAVDNLSQFKPHLKSHEVEAEVARFEESILFFADAYGVHGPGSKGGSGTISPVSDSLFEGAPTPASDETTPEHTSPHSASCSRSPSVVASFVRSPSFNARLLQMLNAAARARNAPMDSSEVSTDDGEEANAVPSFAYAEVDDKTYEDVLEAWQLEAANVDRSVRILPGVKKLIDSIPAGRYAVATSGARTYAYGCMNRVGITPPPVTITADDKRLKAGKPAPDPFLLAADCLGFDAQRCVVFEDSPSGIRAGVASGATVIAVCTSHERSQIENCGAHFIVENMECVRCVVEGSRLKFSVTV